MTKIKTIFAGANFKEITKYFLLLVALSVATFFLTTEVELAGFLKLHVTTIYPLIQQDITEIHQKHPKLYSNEHLLNVINARGTEHEALIEDLSYLVDRYSFSNITVATFNENKELERVASIGDIPDVPSSTTWRGAISYYVLSAFETHSITFYGPYSSPYGRRFSFFIPIYIDDNPNAEAVEAVYVVGYNSDKIKGFEEIRYRGIYSNIFYVALLYILVFILDISTQTVMKIVDGKSRLKKEDE